MNEVEEMMAVESLTSLEAEQTVLGAILIDPAAIVKCAALTPEKFYQAQHKIIFRALLDMAAAGLSSSFYEVQSPAVVASLN